MAERLLSVSCPLAPTDICKLCGWVGRPLARMARSREASQSFSAIRDLVVIVTLRFPEVDQGRMRLHEAWRLGWGFADKLVHDHKVAVVGAMHVPAHAAKPGYPHLHLLIPARQLLPSGFGKFARPLATDEGRAIVEKAWVVWREAADAAE